MAEELQTAPGAKESLDYMDMSEISMTVLSQPRQIPNLEKHENILDLTGNEELQRVPELRHYDVNQLLSQSSQHQSQEEPPSQHFVYPTENWEDPANLALNGQDHVEQLDAEDNKQEEELDKNSERDWEPPEDHASMQPKSEEFEIQNFDQKMRSKFI